MKNKTSKKRLGWFLVILLWLSSETAVSQESGYLSSLQQKYSGIGLDFPKSEIQGLDFTLKKLSGQSIKLTDLKGKVVFLNFWATWCPPCRVEMPAMQNLHNRLKDKGLKILAVSAPDARQTETDIRDYISQNSYTFDVLLDDTGRTSYEYAVSALPTTYIIDKQGRLVARWIGAVTWDEESYMAFFEDLLSR